MEEEFYRGLSTVLYFFQVNVWWRRKLDLGSTSHSTVVSDTLSWGLGRPEGLSVQVLRELMIGNWSGAQPTSLPTVPAPSPYT